MEIFQNKDFKLYKILVLMKNTDSGFKREKKIFLQEHLNHNNNVKLKLNNL